MVPSTHVYRLAGEVFLFEKPVAISHPAQTCRSVQYLCRRCTLNSIYTQDNHKKSAKCYGN
eukprot:m.278005 g.278005  ORF g.278005 m.278005 type:complete len:61 (-) comp19792_c0_seq3:102-284(-)